MRKNKIKDEIFVLKQPSHAVMSVVVVNTNTFPIDDKIHNILENLTKESDVFFVFSDRYFPNLKYINKNKFTSLYESCGWIDSNYCLYTSILKLMQYSMEIFNSHVGYSLMNLTDICNLGKKYFNNITAITSSTSLNPIFKINRLSSMKFYDIYNKPEKTVITNIFTKEYSEDTDIVNMYSSYTSESNVLYFKRNIIDVLIKFWMTEDKSKKYIDSFDNNDFRYFFASLVKYLNISTINSNIEDLDIGTL